MTRINEKIINLQDGQGNTFICKAYLKKVRCKSSVAGNIINETIRPFIKVEKKLEV